MSRRSALSEPNGDNGQMARSDLCSKCGKVGRCCLVSLDASQWGPEIKGLSSGERLCVRGMSVSQMELESLLAVLSRDSSGRVSPPAIDFGGVHFSGDADFGGVHFSGDADFGGVHFSGDADFGGVHFSGDADFGGVHFSGDASFRDAQFCHGAYFGNAQFFGYSGFNEAQFVGEADLSEAHFEVARDLGPMRMTRELIIDGATFREHVKVVVRARDVSVMETRFASGADIHAQSATITFEGATFGARSSVSSAMGDEMPRSWNDPNVKPTIPRIVSFRGARIGELALTLVDLRSCEFSGAQGLEGVHLEQVFFDQIPRGLRRWRRWAKSRRFPIAYASPRWAIAEELRWRDENQPWLWWFVRRQSDTEARGSIQATRCPTPHQISAIYRALRSGREGRKDEPGAADFYYGEMEMRRHTSSTETVPGEPVALKEGYDSTRPTPVGEKAVLFLYWLTSGYGLRATRALLALFVTIACGAFLLWRIGLPDGLSPPLVAVESSISLLHASETSHQTFGTGSEVVVIALRLLGPLFFGLALLSLRGRIKR